MSPQCVGYADSPPNDVVPVRVVDGRAKLRLVAGSATS